MKYDAHIKARRALARRVLARLYEWGLFSSLRGLTQEELLASAYAAISGHRWARGWDNKYGPYTPFDGRQVIGRCKSVPAAELHSIMCRMGRR